MSEARIGWGGELQLGLTTAAASLVEIGEVREFNLPAEEADEAEVTHLKSPNRRKEFIAGLLDAGTVEATVNYVPGGASDLLLSAARDAGDTRAVRFIIPDETGSPEWQITTSGFVKRYSPNAVTPGEPITATVAIRVTGARSEGAETNQADS